MADYILYITVKGIIFLMRFVPLSIWLFLARAIGSVYYFFAARQNKKAYLNLKLAFPHRPRRRLKKIIRGMYRRFAQNFMETLYLAHMDENYIKSHVKISDMSVVEDAKKGNHGILFLGAHAGSWELSNVACGLLFRDNHYAMLAQPQKRTKRLDVLLNQARATKGCSVISVNELKKMVEHLSCNYFLGLVADHGGKDGMQIDFFGKLAPTPIGSVRLAKKLGSKIIVSYMRRIKGPHHEMLFKPLELVSTSDAAKDMEVNLRRINEILEGWISQYPQEYLWIYKRWKYSTQKNILVLSDGKRGHEKQSQSLVEMIASLGFFVKSETAECIYKNKAYRIFSTFLCFILGPRAIFWMLSFCFKKRNYKNLMQKPYDIVISAGSSLVGLNCALTAENSAKSIVIMRPGIFSTRRFSLVIMPEHDKPPKRDNVVATLGSLNTVSVDSIKKDFQDLASTHTFMMRDWNRLVELKNPKIGLLIGGNSRNYIFEKEKMDVFSQRIKKVLDEQDAVLFLTTSRRTPQDITGVLKKHFKDSPKCPFFVVANEENPKGSVGGIFYLSDIIVVSGESISMVSESVASGKPVIVFEPRRIGSRGKIHDFLGSLARNNIITLVPEDEIYDKLCWVLKQKPQKVPVNTNEQVLEKLKKIL